MSHIPEEIVEAIGKAMMRNENYPLYVFMNSLCQSVTIDHRPDLVKADFECWIVYPNGTVGKLS